MDLGADLVADLVILVDVRGVEGGFWVDSGDLGADLTDSGADLADSRADLGADSGADLADMGADLWPVLSGKDLSGKVGPPTKTRQHLKHLPGQPKSLALRTSRGVSRRPWQRAFGPTPLGRSDAGPA